MASGINLRPIFATVCEFVIDSLRGVIKVGDENTSRDKYLIANYLRKERRKIPGSVESGSFTKTGKIKNTTQTHEIKSEIEDIYSYLSNTVSIVHCTNIFFIQNFDKSCHSSGTLGGTHCETINIFLRNSNCLDVYNHKQFRNFPSVLKVFRTFCKQQPQH